MIELIDDDDDDVPSAEPSVSIAVDDVLLPIDDADDERALSPDTGWHPLLNVVGCGCIIGGACTFVFLAICVSIASTIILLYDLVCVHVGRRIHRACRCCCCGSSTQGFTAAQRSASGNPHAPPRAHVI